MRAAVLLAGSGHCDGSEVSEAALAFTMLEKYQIEYKSFSLSKEIKVVNHSIGKEINDYRNAQVESSRIARGFVDDLKNLKVCDFDILVMPGGVGATTVFSTLQKEGKKSFTVIPELYRILNEFYEAKKEIVGICIVPLLLASFFHSKNISVEMTLGDQEESIQDLKSLQMKPKKRSAKEYVYDQEHHVWTTSAFMNATSRYQILVALDEIFRRIEKVESKLMECSVCNSGDIPFTKEEAENKLPLDWKLIDDKGTLKLQKTLKFKDFKGALHFVNQVSEMAESLGHHPNITFTWGEVKIIVYTHKILGLHQNDFIFAAKLEALL